MTTFNEDLALLGRQGDPANSDLTHLISSTAESSKAYAQIIGLALEAGLDYIRTVALLLKFETERQQRDGSVEMFNGRVLLSKWPVRRFYDALRTAFDDEAVGSIDELNMLVTEMRLLGLDQVAADSDALEFFAKQNRLTREQTLDADLPTRRRYDLGKQAWLRLNDELGELSLFREDRVLRMEALRQEFMQLFAVEFLAERSQRARLEIASMALELLRKQPDLTAAEIDEQLREEIQTRKAALAEYQLSAAYGLQTSADIDLRDAPEDLAETKLLLRKLAMLIHPDRLADLPLTNEQRQQLTRIWHDTNRLRAEGGAGGLLSRSNDVLRQNIRRAQQILEMAGIEDLDPTSTIRGSTLQERIEWLDGACEALEHRIASIQAELYVIGSDQELNFMRAMLNAPESVQEEERETMKRNAERYRKEARETEQKANLILEANAEIATGSLH